MSAIRRYNAQNWLPSLFNDFFDNDWMVKANATAPAINVIESDTDYKVEVAAPGMKKEDFTIHVGEDNERPSPWRRKTKRRTRTRRTSATCARNSLTRSSSRRSSCPTTWTRKKIAASVNDGVLTIDLPKRTPEEKAKVNRMIEIK